MGKYRGLDTDEGWIRRELAAVKRDLTEQAAARRLVFQSAVAQGSTALAALPATWTSYLPQTVTPPAGYLYATVLVRAGVTVTTPPASGITTVHVRPVVAGTVGPEQAHGIGPAGGSPAWSALCARFALTGPFTLALSAYGEGTAAGVTVQLDAAITYTRG